MRILVVGLNKFAIRKGQRLPCEGHQHWQCHWVHLHAGDDADVDGEEDENNDDLNVHNYHGGGDLILMMIAGKY